MTARRKSAPPPKEDFFSRLPVRTQHIIALVFLVILPVILFDAAVLGGEQVMGHDTIQWRAGAESVIDYREQTGEEPLWATNMFSGMPAYLISSGKAVYNVDNLVKDLFDSITPAAHYWILLIGVYVFFILQGIRPFSAALGAVLIGFTAYIPIIIGAGHNTKFVAYSFMPWVLTGYWLMSRHKNWLAGFFVLAFTLTLEFRSNHPQVTYYFIYLLLFWWGFDTYRHHKNKELNVWLKRTGWMAGAV
ncbi:MAG: hypothetical protein ACOC4S_01420, partial [Balneolaceae bacterium]